MAHKEPYLYTLYVQQFNKKMLLISSPFLILSHHFSNDRNLELHNYTHAHAHAHAPSVFSEFFPPNKSSQMTVVSLNLNYFH